MAAKVKQDLLKNYKFHCDEAEELAILECFKLPAPFMTTLSLLSSSQCLDILSNFPLGNNNSKETDANNIILLYGLSDAVVHCFLYHEEYSMFANRTCRVPTFLKICRYLEKHWTKVFVEYNKQEFSDNVVRSMKSLLTLLKDCSNRLQGTEESSVFHSFLKFGERSLDRFISKSTDIENQSTTVMQTSCPKMDCSCVMCFSSCPKSETPVKVGAIKVRSLSELTASAEKKCEAKKLLPSPFTQMKVRKVVSPMKPSENTFVTKVASPMMPFKSIFTNTRIDPAPTVSDPILISDSPMKLCHNNNYKLTPEKKSPLKISTQMNENPSKGPHAIKKTMLDFVKPVSAKRPLFPDAVSNTAVPQKKPCPENTVLSNGKINAFAFMMRAAKPKKNK